MMDIFWDKVVSLRDEIKVSTVSVGIGVDENRFQYSLFSNPAYYAGCCINMLVRSRVWETRLFYSLPFHQLPQELLYLPEVQIDPSALLVRPLHERLVSHYHPVAEITGKKTSGNSICNLWISKWKWPWGLAVLTWSPLMPTSPLAPGKPSSPCGTLRNDNMWWKRSDEKLKYCTVICQVSIQPHIRVWQEQNYITYLLPFATL